MIKKYCLFILFACSLSNLAKADNDNHFLADSILIQLPNGVTILESADFSKGKSYLTTSEFDSVFSSFCDNLKLLDVSNKFMSTPQTIVWSTDKWNIYDDGKMETIRIKDRDFEAKFTIPVQSKELYYQVGKHVLELHMLDRTVYVYFDTLEQLLEINAYSISDVYLNVEKEFFMRAPKPRKRVYYTRCKIGADDQINAIDVTESQIGYKVNNSYLSLGLGTELIKDHWTCDIKGSLVYEGGPKAIPRQRIELSYEWKYDFSTSDHKNINQFVSADFSLNSSKKMDTPRWYGLSAGYLVHQQGDLFDDHTAFIGLVSSSQFVIEPRVYFHDFFKGGFPAVHISYNF